MKKVLILCNGCPPNEKLFHKIRANANCFIAADGGGNIARQFNSHPDIVIGDLDSYKRSGDEPYDVIHQASQESNDLEKALDHAHNIGATQVEILGGTGYRLDQTLKNLSVLKQYDPYFQALSLLDDYGRTSLIDSPFESTFAQGTTLSLFPLSGKVSGITTRGLKYPLNDEALENGVRDGSSNEVVDNPVRITYKRGDLVLFVKT